MNDAKVLLAAVVSAFAAVAVAAPAGELKVSADLMAADNISGTLVASGHVRAVSAPLCLVSELVEKRGDEYHFHDSTRVTTCTNDLCRLHWEGRGEVIYREGRHAVARNMTLRMFGVPVFWFPYWYYPIDTDYGWRVMPGYTSRWGVYLMTKYVYGIAGGFDPGEFGLSGATRLDLRAKNGVAVGQSLHWQLGDFGRGQFKVYYAWDEDADTYDHHWTSRRWHYENWGSSVPDERYALMLAHRWDPTERDIVRLRGAYYSDSHFRGDFLRDGHFGQRNRFLGHDGNELAAEHVENAFAAGVSASGPLNDFYGGVARLPEAYFDVMPRPVFGLPADYESETRAGWLNRNYAKHGSASTTAVPFRYAPGQWADYQAFRFDTYHRLSAPFKVADVVSVVPRLGVRGTYWSDSGYENLDGRGRAGSTGDGLWRTIVEGGATFAARGVADLGDGVQHVLEPYADFLAQEAEFHGRARGERPYWFDSVDGSADWLDQYAGRSRNLPYSWYGVTPGLRNALRRADEKGRMRTVLDFDVYAAVQFNDTEWTEGGRHHRLVRDPSDPNYGRHRYGVAPGARVRWRPAEGTSLSARAEYDAENEAVAYADVEWRQIVSPAFKYSVSYVGRDHRWWDFSSSPYDPEVMRNEDFNRARFGYLEFEAEHEVCDAFAWGPLVRWDCREAELDEIGAWIDLRTDCLGFRFSVAYESDYERIDRSKSSEDWRFGFFVYLRALGPSSGNPF